MGVNKPIARLISGAQPGADRGGLDAAIELGIPHGGYRPRGRLAEDGPIPARYAVTELRSPAYAARSGVFMRVEHEAPSGSPGSRARAPTNPLRSEESARAVRGLGGYLVPSTPAA